MLSSRAQKSIDDQTHEPTNSAELDMKTNELTIDKSTAKGVLDNEQQYPETATADTDKIVNVSGKKAQTNGASQVKEINGPKGLEPTRYGDWESKGRCYDF